MTTHVVKWVDEQCVCGHCHVGGDCHCGCTIHETVTQADRPACYPKNMITDYAGIYKGRPPT